VRVLLDSFKKSVFLFRRDLRVEDNTGLISASRASEKVIPCFIQDPKFIKKSNPKYSEFRGQFMQDCLEDLDGQLHKVNSSLHLFQGETLSTLQKIIKKLKIDAVFVNTDYSPFGLSRDKKIQEMCKKENIGFFSFEDQLLHVPESIKNGKDEPYKVFTAFYNKAKELPYRKVQNYKFENLISEKTELTIPVSKLDDIFGKNNSMQAKGGRTEGLKLMKNLKNLKNYNQDRNFPALPGTSRLSAHNKFGTLSIREIYQECADTLGVKHTIVSELHWRDFFIHLMYHYPYSYSKEFNKNFQKIKWDKDSEKFSKWKNGETGFPIVDAGMRELNQTGFMHTRVRMIVASFLTKDLHIDWRLGEQYFASKLVDYDPCVNTGCWQWSASTGCDAQPWFRIFNPWLQQAKFDPDCVYIKKWLPELSDVSPKVLHELWKNFPSSIKYPKPIVEHKIESDKSKSIFKSLTASAD
jgi:deoxyribodipyrimidine photo-lyase